jgi:hypothetical protein
MSVLGFILFGSVLVVPLGALWALRWAARHGELGAPERAALLPFDEEEPVGQSTDQILNHRAQP